MRWRFLERRIIGPAPCCPGIVYACMRGYTWCVWKILRVLVCCEDRFPHVAWVKRASSRFCWHWFIVSVRWRSLNVIVDDAEDDIRLV